MKTVTIPNDERPVFRCKINGNLYEYPAGATMSVPDAVAELIENINASKPTPRQYDPPAQTLPHVTSADNGKVLKVSGGVWTLGTDNTGATLPDVTDDDNGSVLGVVDGAWTKDSRLFETVGTFGGTNDNKTTITLDKTAEACFAAIAAGRTVVLSGQVSETVSIVEVLPVCAEKITSGVQTGFKFRVTNEAGTGFTSGELPIAGDAAVVLTEE